MDNNELLKRGLTDLMISLLPGIGLKEKILLLQKLNSEDEIFVQSKRDIECLLNRTLKTYWDISDIKEKAGRIDTICRMRSINWLSWNSPDYPPLLSEIYDPPSVIFYRGCLPNPDRSILGMVGTRKPSPEASEQAYKIAGNIACAGVSVVSGLAIGIDAMSHRGNLVGNVPGYAVLGSGIDEVFPSVNKPLAKRILDSGGAIISEYPPGVPPSKWTFPARNRIIAGLSRSVLVVEAPLKSGALITANFALDMGKDLWVASCGALDNSSYDRRGTVRLVNDGAEIIESASDILERWQSENVYEQDLTMRQRNCLNSRSDLVSSMAELLKIDI